MNAIKIVLFVVSVSVFSKTFLAEKPSTSGPSRDTSDESSSEEDSFFGGSWQDLLKQLSDEKNWDLDSHTVKNKWMKKAIKYALQAIMNKVEKEDFLAGELYHELDQIFDKLFSQMSAGKRDIDIDTIVILFKNKLKNKIRKRQKSEKKQFTSLLSNVSSDWIGYVDQNWKQKIIEQSIKLFKLNLEKENIFSQIATAINDYNGKLTWLQRSYKISENEKKDIIISIEKEINNISSSWQELKKEFQKKIDQESLKKNITKELVVKQQEQAQEQKKETVGEWQVLLTREDEGTLQKKEKEDEEILRQLNQLQKNWDQKIEEDKKTRLDTWNNVLNELKQPKKDWEEKVMPIALDLVEHEDKDKEQIEKELAEAFKGQDLAGPKVMDFFSFFNGELVGRKQKKIPITLFKKEREREIVNSFIKKTSNNNWKKNLLVLSRTSTFWDFAADMPNNAWIQMAVDTAIDALSNDQATKDMLINDLEEKLKIIYGVPTLEITVPVLLETYVYRVPELEKKKIVTIKTSFEQQLDHKMPVALKVKLLKRQNDIKSLIEKELLKEKQQQQEKEQEQKDWALIQKERKQRYVKQQALDPDYQKRIDEQKERGKKLGQEELQTISIIKKDLEHKQQIEKEKLEKERLEKEDLEKLEKIYKDRKVIQQDQIRAIMQRKKQRQQLSQKAQKLTGLLCCALMVQDYKNSIKI